MFFAFIKITTRILFGVVKKDWKRNRIVLPVLSFLLSKVRVNKPQTSPVIDITNPVGDLTCLLVTCYLGRHTLRCLAKAPNLKYLKIRQTYKVESVIWLTGKKER
jgi:hypothetical protein